MELFAFGPHLMIDGYHAQSESLAQAEPLAAALLDLATILDMRVHTPPQVWSCSESTGLIGVLLLPEAQISIYTFSEQQLLHLDIFSARDLDAQVVIQWLNEHFEIGRYTAHFIHRGRELPQDLNIVERIVRGERQYIAARLT